MALRRLCHFLRRWEQCALQCCPAQPAGAFFLIDAFPAYQGQPESLTDELLLGIDFYGFVPPITQAKTRPLRRIGIEPEILRDTQTVLVDVLLFSLVPC